MKYTAAIASDNPTCFLFLIDQSESMLRPMAGTGRAKAEVVADALNSLFQHLCMSCAKGTTVRDRFYLGVIGYGAQVGPALGGLLAGQVLAPVSAVAYNPLRIQPSGRGGAPAPVWVEPFGQGQTPMCAALRLAMDVLGRFLADHPFCFPPVVLNLTDGRATDGDPLSIADPLRALSSTDGNVLLFNARISATGRQRVLFPDSEAVLPDDSARLMFRLSSVLPPPMADMARLAGYPVTATTRGFVYNADLDAIVQFLNFGTTFRPSARL